MWVMAPSQTVAATHTVKPGSSTSNDAIRCYQSVPLLVLKRQSAAYEGTNICNGPLQLLLKPRADNDMFSAAAFNWCAQQQVTHCTTQDLALASGAQPTGNQRVTANLTLSDMQARLETVLPNTGRSSEQLWQLAHVGLQRSKHS